MPKLTLSFVLQSRTYQDLLKNSHDEALFEHYTTSQVVSIKVGFPFTFPSEIEAGCMLLIVARMFVGARYAASCEPINILKLCSV